MARYSYWTNIVSLGERWYWRTLRDVGTNLLSIENLFRRQGNPSSSSSERRDSRPWPFDLRVRVEDGEGEEGVGVAK